MLVTYLNKLHYKKIYDEKLSLTHAYTIGMENKLNKKKFKINKKS